MIAIQHLEPGARLRTKSGAIVEIAENPRDGVWLVVRSVNAGGAAAEGTDLLHVDEVVMVYSADERKDLSGNGV